MMRFSEDGGRGVDTTQAQILGQGLDQLFLWVIKVPVSACKYIKYEENMQLSSLITLA